MTDRDEPEKGGGGSDGATDRAPQRKDFWDKLQASGTILIAVVVALIGGIFNYQQTERELRVKTESEFYTSLLAQRESTDSELRVEMFKTLIETYFGGRLAADSAAIDATTHSAPPGGESGLLADAGPAGPDFAALEQRIMFLDVLVRNFENIDIGPLFEDLDRRLTEIVWSSNRVGGGVGEAERRAFGLRWQLRSAALGNVARQVSALTALEGTRVERLRIREGACSTEPGGGGDGIDEPRFFPFGVILINRLEDGSVYLSLILDNSAPDKDGSAQPQKLDFQVTSFDTPVLENIRLPTGERLAVTLEHYFAPAEYASFVDEIPGEAARFDYRSFLDRTELQTCREATLTLLQFPDGYIGPRDRPYIQNLIKTKL